MGYGPIFNGKQTPITPYRGSWAEGLKFPDRPVMPVRDARFDRPSKQWPIGHPPKPKSQPDT